MESCCVKEDSLCELLYDSTNKTSFILLIEDKTPSQAICLRPPTLALMPMSNINDDIEYFVICCNVKKKEAKRLVAIVVGGNAAVTTCLLSFVLKANVLKLSL